MVFHPRIRQMYFCRFPDDRESPEFGKTRPVVIFSRRNGRGVAQVIPITTAVQRDGNLSVKLSSTAKDGRDQWAVCNHLTTVSVKRLQRSRVGKPIGRMSYEDFQKVKETVFRNFPD